MSDIGGVEDRFILTRQNGTMMGEKTLSNDNKNDGNLTHYPCTSDYTDDLVLRDVAWCTVEP